MDIMGWIGTGEGRPQEIGHVHGGESGIILEDDQGIGLQLEGGQGAAEFLQLNPGFIISRERDTTERQDTRSDQCKLLPPVRKSDGWHFRAQGADHLSPAGHHHLGPCIPPGTGIVEGVHGGLGLKMQIAFPSDAFQHMAEEGGDIVGVQLRMVRAVGNDQEFGQGGLALAEQVIGLGEDLLRHRLAEGHVSFRTDRQQERVNS